MLNVEELGKVLHRVKLGIVYWIACKYLYGLMFELYSLVLMFNSFIMVQVDKIEKLKSFKDEAEFREFLIDLLIKMGFKDVMHTHRYGAPESGKDIIGRYPHDLEGDDWYSFVVKKGRIGGGTNEIETIKNQIYQSFEYKYTGINGESISINKVKVVTNENFTGGAQTQISSSSKLKTYNNFSFWWNENLIPIIDENYPDFWLPGDAFAKEYSKQLRSDVEKDISIRELRIRRLDDKKIKKLLDIYIEPKLTKDVIEENTKTKVKEIKTRSVNIKHIDDIKTNLLLSGEQGAGKTKTLNTILCNLCDPNYIHQNKKIPVKLKATLIRDNQFNISELINNSIKELANQFYDEELIKEYKIILFIDDFDLLNVSEKDELFDKLKEYCDENETNYVLTHRKSEIDYDNTADTINIHNFNVKQVETFVTKFFEGTDRAERFIQVLKESDIFSKLPTTPLTVTLISLLYDENNNEIPATLSDIYTDFSNVLLGKLNVQDRGSLLIFNIKLRIFSAFALEMLDDNKYEYTFDKFRKFVNEFLTERGYQEQTEEEITQIIHNSGLLYRSESNMVGFKQQSFIEYFASHEIYHHKRGSHYDKLHKKFNEIVWQNTAIFYAGLSKELEGMIDDVIKNSPNETLKDWFVNSSGMGYLAQALYQTKPSERKKLVRKSLENILLCVNEVKEQSKDKNSHFYKIPLPLIYAMLSYWFGHNFKSVTLVTTLKESFDEILLEENNSDNNYCLMTIATALMSNYIDDDSKMLELMEREEFMKHPLLPLVADMVLDINSVDKKSTSKELREKIQKQIEKKRDYINKVIKEPAYRFNESFALEKGG